MTKKKTNWKDKMIYCHRCKGSYTPSPDWRLVRDHSRGTEGARYSHAGNIDEEHCPCCAMYGWHKPPQLEPTFYPGPM